MERAASLRLLSWGCLGVLALAFIGHHFLTSSTDQDDGQFRIADEKRNNIYALLGSRGALIFDSLDSDSNGDLSAEEFAPLVQALTGEGAPVVRNQTRAGSGGDTVTLTASFTPLDFSSMKIVQDEGMKGLMRNAKNLRGLGAWRQPEKEQQDFIAAEFRPFMPLLPVPVGKAYFMYKPNVEKYWQGSSVRYYPPVPQNNEVILYKLLRMLHPRPFLLTRFGPHGTVAVVRAENDEYYDIAFRIHAEFQLNEPPVYPFWYSPAQFSGSLIIAKDGSKVEYFSLSVPNDRELNVDMEWVTNIDEVSRQEKMEVEIGYMSRMEIRLNGTEVPALQWRTNVSYERAASALEQELYPFKKIQYLPLPDAFNKAETEQKLVHSIVLWGSLDDQSC